MCTCARQSGPWRFFTGRLSEESCVPVCWRCCEIKNSPPPGGKAKLSGVRGRRHQSGHTRVRTLFTTGEAHLRPPTSAPPLQYRTMAGGAVLHYPLGGNKAPHTASLHHDIPTQMAFIIHQARVSVICLNSDPGLYNKKTTKR